MTIEQVIGLIVFGIAATTFATSLLVAAVLVHLERQAHLVMILGGVALAAAVISADMMLPY